MATKYKAIVIDPPWTFKAGTKGRPQHYQRLTDMELALMPIYTLAHPEGCWFFIWSTSAMTMRMFALAGAWGLKFSGRAFIWIKTHKRSGDKPLFYHRDGFHMGLGLTTRKNAEDLWLFKLGHPARKHAGIRELIVAPLREHSRKPDEAYMRIEQFCDGPYCDLFARQSRKGWTTWGDESTKFDTKIGIYKHGRENAKRNVSG